MARISSVGSQRRLRGLNRMRWDDAYIAREVGMSIGSIVGVKTGDVGDIDTEEALKIQRFYDTYWDKDGGSAEAYGLAVTGRYPPPICWDDDTINDPAVGPEWGISGRFHPSVMLELALLPRVPDKLVVLHREGLSMAEVMEYLGVESLKHMRTQARKAGVKFEEV